MEASYLDSVGGHPPSRLSQFNIGFLPVDTTGDRHEERHHAIL